MSLPFYICQDRSKGFLPKFWFEWVASFWSFLSKLNLGYDSISRALPSCNDLSLKNLDRSLFLMLPKKNFGNPLRGNLHQTYLPRRNGSLGFRPSKFRRDWLDSWRTCLHFCHQFELSVWIVGKRVVVRKVRTVRERGCERETPLYWCYVTK